MEDDFCLETVKRMHRMHELNKPSSVFIKWPQEPHDPVNVVTVW